MVSAERNKRGKGEGTSERRQKRERKNQKCHPMIFRREIRRVFHLSPNSSKALCSVQVLYRADVNIDKEQRKASGI
jgi:hypothetical protein